MLGLDIDHTGTFPTALEIDDNELGRSGMYLQ